MQAPVISTAGPAGHGKTALVRALAGPLGDARDDAAPGAVALGFAFHDVGGRRIGIVDPPGNERLVRGLLSDVHGFDLVLLVVAADEGIRPQTEECVDLLHLLGARRVAVAITKTDLVTPQRVAEVRGALAGSTRETSFAGAPIHVVSSTTGAGIAALREEITALPAPPATRDQAWFRMYVDRSFYTPERGLTAIGTVLAGTIRTGDALALRPGTRTAEAGTIQVHGETVGSAHTGQRIAVQLGRLERKVLRRGVVLADPQVAFATDRFDCWLEVRPGARAALRSFDHVELDVGTVETAGSVLVLGGDALAPGASGFCQVVLEKDVIVAHGDRFVLRPDGGARTTGGGIVLHPFAVRHRSADPELLARLARLREPALAPRLLAFLELLPELAAPLGYVAQGLDRLPAVVRDTAAGVPELIALPGAGAPEAYTTRVKWQKLVAAVVDVLTRFHRTHPLEPGMDPEALRARLPVPVPPRLLDAVVARLAAEQTIVRADDRVRLARLGVTPPTPTAAAARRAPAATKATAPQRADTTADPASRVRATLAAAGFTPPDLRQLEAQLAIPTARLQQILATLEQERAVVTVAPDLCFDRAALERAQALLVDFLAGHDEITVADYRTLLGASRKYALALLDHFDRTGLTTRVGDARRLRG